MLLSICIPTRNRSQYLTEVVCALSSQFPNDVEIVVSDNSEIQNPFMVRLANTLSNVVYLYTNDELSFAKNFEKSILAANGKYVTTIGDDDFVFPEVFEAISYAEANNADVIISRLDYVYYWPGLNGRTSQREGALRMSEGLRCDLPKVIHQRQELRKFLANGISEFEKTELARIYHGIVRRDLIRSIIDRHGSLFGGLSPDIYSSVLLSTYASRTVIWTRALTMPGVCSDSGSGQSATGKHRGNLQHAPHFRGNADYRWEDEVPKFYSVDTIWAESAIKALKKCGNLNLELANLDKLFAKSLLNNFALIRTAIPMCLDAKAKISWIRIFSYMLILGIAKTVNRLKRKNYSVFPAPETIAAAAANIKAKPVQDK